MAFKTILVHCDADKKLAQRLDVATGLAEAHGGHLVGSYIRPPFQPPVVFDSGFAVAMNDFYNFYEESTKADQEDASAKFAAAIKGKSHSSEWRRADGPIDSELALQARYADLTIVGQSNPDAPTATPLDLPQYVAMTSGRPTLVIPHAGISKPPGKNVLLCWNESREAARAASDALPILMSAAYVTVLVVDDESANAEGRRRLMDRLEAWFGRHGVKARALEQTGAAREVGDLILSRAADLNADLIVMGVYGHSRAREFVLGGASRTLLASMTVPVFMAH